MPVTPVTKYFKITLFFKNAEWGWSETYVTNKSGDLEGQVAYANGLIVLRQYLMPPGCSIIFGRVTEVPASRKQQPAAWTQVIGQTDELTTPVAGECNRVEDALHFKFTGSSGKQAARHFRGVPDALITDKTFTIDEPAGGWGNAASPGHPPVAVITTYQAALNTFLTYLKEHTFLASPKTTVTIAGQDVIGYNLDSIGSIIFRRVITRNTGRPFGSPRGRVMPH